MADFFSSCDDTRNRCQCYCRKGSNPKHGCWETVVWADYKPGIGYSKRTLGKNRYFGVPPPPI